MKRNRSSSSKESKEGSSSVSKRPKSVGNAETSVKQHLASLPTHGEVVLERNSAYLPTLAAKSISDIRQGLASVRKHKRNSVSNEESDTAMSDSKRKILLGLQFLKKLNRLSHLHCKDRRDMTQKVKSEVDDLHLQLQNLTYEYNHLLRETANCLEFKSQHEDLDLVDVETFYQEAPTDISCPALRGNHCHSEQTTTEPQIQTDSTKVDEHQQMLARLEWELQERKRLTGEKDALVQEITSFKDDIQKRQEYLDSLQPSLNTLLKASLPVQEFMDMPLNKERDELDAARLLPVPMYILFVQVKGYSEAVDGSVKVCILGDTSEAESFLLQSSQSQNEDSDTEEDKHRNEESNRKHRKDGQLRDKLLKPFPLGIELRINVEKNISVVLVFTYLTQLKLVCVSTKDLAMPDVQDSGDHKSLFHHLLVYGDDGLHLPHIAAAFLKKHSKTVSIEDYGHPYQWAHALCGIKNLPSEPTASAMARSDSSQQLTEKVVRAVKKRILSQISLAKQLQQIGALDLQRDVRDQHLFPPNMHTKLIKWQALSDASLQGALQEFPNAFLFNAKEPTNKVYQAVFTPTDSSVNIHLHCLVCISIMYPSVPPFVALKVELNANRLVHNIQLKELEREININFKHLTEDDDGGQRLLLRQLLKAQMCFDVYLTCSGVTHEGPLPKAMIPTKYMGPTKSYPYKYSHETGMFHH